MPELLLELLSEEIPARMQARAADDLKRLVCERLTKEQLGFDRARAFVTPRRLALVVEGLPVHQPHVREERKGPRVGSPEKALKGFVRANGLASIADTEVRETDKGSFYFAKKVKIGEETIRVLGRVIGDAIYSLPWPKSMRWGCGRFRFIRPLQNLLCIFAGEVVPLSIENPQGGNDSGGFVNVELDPDPYLYSLLIVANAKTCGHRFLAPAEFQVRHFADYGRCLRAAKVMLDPAERRTLIASGVRQCAADEGLSWREDEALLDEVTGLVEWPVPMLGCIDPAFMDVPAEVLVTAMRAHQKYFSLLDAEGRLAPRFVLVANTEAIDGGAAIVAGNERVLRARLFDAKFFWDEDRKRTLESRLPKLAERVFHAKLGSDFERTDRLEALARALAPLCGADPDLAARAARLSKADLTSAMVGEFPELQGIMGRYYALHDGESAEVADAIAEHYAPLGPSDRCPTAPIGIAAALADKIDTLAGFFAIGEKPTGSKDPFALRRAALGVIRLIMENRLRLSLLTAFDQAASLVGDHVSQVAKAQDDSVHGRGSAIRKGRTAICWELLGFFADRLKVHLREQGVRHDLIAAVFADGGEDDLVRLLARVDALRVFLDTDDGANLLVAYRRASNIVRIEENKDDRHYEGEADVTLLTEDQEAELHRALVVARPGIAQAVSEERFGDAMAILAGLRAPVDAFFDGVQVNCADADLRINRLKLLSQIRSALGGVADFSQIEG